MPTNEFQQLVYLIQHQLSHRPGTRVTESKKLIDRNTGKKREVDIVIETSEGEIPFVLGFETRRRSRKPNIEWVEQQIKKHEHLTDKLVLVANRPFAADAVDLARRSGVETIELSDATKTDWPAFIDQYGELFVGGFEFSVKTFRLEFENLGHTEALDPEQPVIVTQGELSASLSDAIKSVLTNRAAFGEPAMDAWYRLPLVERRDEHTINLDATPNADMPWILHQGSNTYRVTRIQAEIAVKVGTAALLLNQTEYKGARVTHGVGKLQKGGWDGQSMHVVMTERAGQKAQAAVMLVGTDPTKAVVRTFDLNDVAPPDQGSAT